MSHSIRNPDWESRSDLISLRSFARGARYGSGHATSGGFALVLALSLMAFVLVLILSISAFVTVEAKVSSLSRQRIAAKENAYLGVMVALGNLQRYAGADLRSTARADIMAEGNQFWTGVWHSNPLQADYDPNSWPVWLVSGKDDLSLNDPGAEMDFSDTSIVELVPASSTAPAIVVAKKKVVATNSFGSYAYWVGDEGIKAKLNKSDPYALGANVDKRRITVAQRNGIEAVVPSYPVGDEKVERVGSVDQFENLSGVSIDDYYHDFTTQSYSLLTDSAQGGLKQDLSAVFRAATLDPAYQEHAVFMTPDRAIFGPRWEYLKDYYHAFGLVNASGGLYPRPPYDSTPGRKGALDVDNGNGDAADPYINITAENDPDGWVAPAFHALTTELGLVLSVSSGSDGFPVIRIHPFVELTNPYNIMMEGGWYEYHIDRFGPTVEFEFTSSSEPAAPPLTISRKFYEYLQDDISTGRVMRMLIHADQTEIEPGRSIRLFPAGIFNSSNIDDYIDSEMPMNRATSLDNWDSGYLEVSIKSDNSTRWPDASEFNAHNYDTLSINASFASSVEPLGMTFFLQRGTQGVASDSAILRGSASVRNKNTNNNYGFVMTWPGDRSISQSFAVVRGKLKSEDEYDPADFSDFIGVFNPRSPLMNSKHLDTSFTGVRAWDWTFELGAVNPDFDTPGGADSHYGYWGSSSTTGEDGGFGPTRTVLFDLPREPMISLGQFQNALLSLYPHEPSYAFGNSYAPKSGIAKTEWYVQTPPLVDVSYALNDALWDQFYFSSLPEGLTVGELSEPLPSSHLEIHSTLEGDDVLAELRKSDEAAAHLRINGGFNVNSVSEAAWAAVLGSMAGLSIEDQASESATTVENAFLRNVTPYGGASREWSGYKDVPSDELYNTDTSEKSLARSIVDEIKSRARSAGQGRPFISLSEFINRRLSSDEYGDVGVVQKAIEDANLNDGTNLFAPGAVTQADILSALGPKLTSRSDTFVIRAYGESISPVTGEKVASAMCEAVVERQPEFVEPKTGSAGNVASASLNELTNVNQKFGRAYKITAFRWID